MRERLKHLPSIWKYGLITVLTFAGISFAGAHFAGQVHGPIAKPPQEVKGAQVRTVTPTSTPTPAPTETPTPTLTPTPTQLYISPTKAYVPPTQAPAEQSDTQLDNNNYYTNVDGNQVHSPANTQDGSVPDGASARCADGTYSFSQHHSGTCSHHGGVSEWL